MSDTKFYLTDAERKRFQPHYRKAQDAVGPYGSADRGWESRITDNYDELPYNEGATPYGGEGLVGTFSDYSKFCRMLLGDGVYKGRRIISSESIDRMTAITTPRFMNGGYDSGFAYGYSLFVLQEPLLDGTGSPAGIYGWGGITIPFSG